ncbi:MAG TPA: alpha/beta fold hydrolase [Gemmatimonadaceae bacterium]
MKEIRTTTGLRLVAEVPPDATRSPLLLVHGMAAGAWHFERWQPFLASRGWPTYAVDLRGHGGSRPAADLGRVSVLDYVEDAREAMAEVARHHAGTRPVLVGHSMGGLIVQKLAESSAPAAVVLLCSAPPRGITVASLPLIKVQLRWRYLKPLLRSRPLVGESADLRALNSERIGDAEWEALFPRFGPESGRAGREISIGGIAVDAARVRCPVLVVATDEDRFVVPRVARALARKYGGTLCEVRGHGHLLLLEPGWEAPAAAVEAWLATLVPPLVGNAVTP